MVASTRGNHDRGPSDLLLRVFAFFGLYTDASGPGESDLNLSLLVSDLLTHKLPGSSFSDDSPETEHSSTVPILRSIYFICMEFLPLKEHYHYCSRFRVG